MCRSARHKWTCEEDQILSDCIEKDQMSHKEVAVVMGLPLRCVTGRCAYLMLSVRKARRELYMEALDNFHEKTNRWLARHMGVNEKTVSRWRNAYQRSAGKELKHGYGIKAERAMA